MSEQLRIAFFGSSLVSSWWNGACTYYRGIVRGLNALGHQVTFYEPIAFQRQEHRDMDDPEYAQVVIYPARSPADMCSAVESARGADVIVKASGVGVYDEVLEESIAASPNALRIFWDVDAPATLARLEQNGDDPLRPLLRQFDCVLTYGGGEPVVERYVRLGARRCNVVYNAVDLDTHHPVSPDPRFRADCALLANRLPDREDRADEFFFRAASLLPRRTFLLGGNGWDGKTMPPNVRWVGHVGTAEHNAFNCAATMILNVTRASMVENGWSPATRVFEAAAAGACLISDSWPGLEEFFTPDTEVLVAGDGADVARHAETVDAVSARRIGSRAAERVRRCHTYEQRATDVERILRSCLAVAP